jgi:serine/threonine protein kinase
MLKSVLVIALSFYSSIQCVSYKSEKHLKHKSSGLTLHHESLYDSSYMYEYRMMIKSLFGPAKINILNEEMIRKTGESRTASKTTIKYRARIPRCSTLGLETMHTVKVLQDEESNYVMLKEDTSTGKLYVEKSTRSESSFEAEMEFFKHLNPASEYFPQLVCHMATPGRRERHSLVTEFIRGRDSHLLAAEADENQLKSMVRQLFDSVVQLHEMGYIHADIKPGNVLVTDDFKVKLIDFGMAARVGEAKKYRGSPYTRAPELHNKCPGEVDVAIDWWAFGATVSIWYFYHYKRQFHNHKTAIRAREAVDYFQIASSYDFTPMKYGGGGFRAGIFPSSFDATVRQFLALFLTIDPELRTFDTHRLHEIVRNHQYFN